MPKRSTTGARPRSLRSRHDTRSFKRAGFRKVPGKVKRTFPLLVQPPGLWWREPLSESALRDAGADEREALIAQERVLKTEQLKERLRTLRKYSSAFDSSNGYTLKTSEIIRLPLAKLKRLNRAFDSLRRAQSHPHVEFHAKTAKQKRAAKQRAGEILPDQKVFLIHHGDARLARAEWKDGIIQITTTVKGGEIYERIYLFDKRPRSWRDVERQSESLMRRGMKTGNYKILNSLYGPIGELVGSDKIMDSLEQFFSTYNQWLAGTILGWIWMGTSLDAARERQRRQKTQAERFQEQRQVKLQREKDLLKKRLGMRVPKRRPHRRLSFYVLYRGSVVSRRYDTRQQAEQYIGRALAMSRGNRKRSDYRIAERWVRIRGDSE